MGWRRLLILLLELLLVPPLPRGYVILGEPTSVPRQDTGTAMPSDSKSAVILPRPHQNQDERDTTMVREMNRMNKTSTSVPPRHSTKAPRIYSAWSDWSECDSNCEQNRTRLCLQPKLCGQLIRTSKRYCVRNEEEGGSEKCRDGIGQQMKIQEYQNQNDQDNHDNVNDQKDNNNKKQKERKGHKNKENKEQKKQNKQQQKDQKEQKRPQGSKGQGGQKGQKEQKEPKKQEGPEKSKATEEPRDSKEQKDQKEKDRQRLRPAGAGGRRHRGEFQVVPRSRLPVLEGDRRNRNQSAAERSNLQYNKLFGRWTRWTPCTRNCTTQRYRWCKRPAKCGGDVIREAAFCYVEGSYCQQLIEQRIAQQRQRSDSENETDSDLDDNLVSEKTSKMEKDLPNLDLGCGVMPTTTNFSSFQFSVRIIGGRPSSKGRWPWQVAVLNRYREAFCGGTLIAPRWVLTAAHCIRKQLYVRTGEHDLSLNEGTETELKVMEVVPHPNYDADTVDNDVALLLLPTPVKQNRYRAFACLPKPRQSLPYYQECSIIGWGKRRPSDAFGTDLLHEVQVPIVSEKVCREVYSDYHITSNMFCAGFPHGRKDSCAGDSGGPLLCESGQGVKRWTVFGITSFGEGCGKSGKFGIYTRLPNYVTWIEAEMRRRDAIRPGSAATRPGLPSPPDLAQGRRRRRRRRRPGQLGRS